MRTVIYVPLLLLSALAFAACSGGGETPAAASPSPMETSDATTAPVIPHSKELTTIYFVHAEW